MKKLKAQAQSIYLQTPRGFDYDEFVLRVGYGKPTLQVGCQEHPLSYWEKKGEQLIYNNVIESYEDDELDVKYVAEHHVYPTRWNGKEHVAKSKEEIVEEAKQLVASRKKSARQSIKRAQLYVKQLKEAIPQLKAMAEALSRWR